MVARHRIGQWHLRVSRLERAAASSSPTGSCGGQARLCARLHPAPLALRQGRKDMPDEFPGGGRRIDGPSAQRAKPPLPWPSSLDQRHAMRHRAPQTIYPPAHEHVARRERLAAGRQTGSRGVGSRCRSAAALRLLTAGPSPCLPWEPDVLVGRTHASIASHASPRRLPLSVVSSHHGPRMVRWGAPDG